MMRDWLIGTAKRNPAALMILAAGCALLMRNGSRDASRGGTAGRSGSRGGPRRATEATSNYASDIKNRVSEAENSASVAGQPYVSSAFEYVGEVGRTMAQQTSHLSQQVPFSSDVGQVLRNPITVVTLGAAVGATVAALFPKTEIEDRALGPARSVVAGAAGAIRENVMDAAEHLMQGAVERGLSSEGLKDLAREAASTFTSEVSGKFDQERRVDHR